MTLSRKQVQQGILVFMASALVAHWTRIFGEQGKQVWTTTGKIYVGARRYSGTGSEELLQRVHGAEADLDRWFGMQAQ